MRIAIDNLYRNCPHVIPLAKKSVITTLALSAICIGSYQVGTHALSLKEIMHASLIEAEVATGLVLGTTFGAGISGFETTNEISLSTIFLGSFGITLSFLGGLAGVAGIKTEPSFTQAGITFAGLIIGIGSGYYAAEAIGNGRRREVIVLTVATTVVTIALGANFAIASATATTACILGKLAFQYFRSEEESRFIH